MRCTNVIAPLHSRRFGKAATANEFKFEQGAL